MNTVEYKNEMYNIENIYIYDELISIYKGNLLETTPIKVKLSEVKILTLTDVSISCPKEAIMHYDNLIKTKLPITFQELRDHGTHAEFCDKINDLREEAKSNYS